MTVRLPAEMRKRIFKQMESAYPDEGGGFLLGELKNNETIIRNIAPVDNVFEKEERHHRYAMKPQDWMRLEDAADEQGLLLVGCYHSHPDSPAAPSEYDRVHALPNFLYLIASVLAAKAVDLRAWKLKADRSAFVSQTVRSEPGDGRSSQMKMN